MVMDITTNKFLEEHNYFPRSVAVRGNTLDFTELKKKYKENKAILFVSLNLPITYEDIGLGRFKGSKEKIKKQFEIILNPYHLRELLEQLNITIENMKKAQKSTTKQKASGHNTRLKKERVLDKK